MPNLPCLIGSLAIIITPSSLPTPSLPVTSPGRAELIRIFLDTGITESIAVDFGEISQVVSAAGEVMFVGHKVTPEQGIYRVNGGD